MSKHKTFEHAREQLKRDVDKLLDAYDLPGCRCGGPLVQVQCFKEDLFFAFEGVDGAMHYRGRILVPVAVRKPSKKFRTAQQVDIEQAKVKLK